MAVTVFTMDSSEEVQGLAGCKRLLIICVPGWPWFAECDYVTFLPDQHIRDYRKTSN